MTSPSDLNKPAAQGFRMPAEWEAHEGTWLSWPKDPVTWPDRVPQVESIFVEMIFHLSQHETVFLMIDDEATQEKVAARLKQRGVYLKNICFHQVKTVDAWTRDYAPNFLVREKNGKKELAMNHWEFNAWGGKYPELMADTQVPKEIESLLSVPRFVPEMVLEGGSIEVNGKGSVLTTEQCLLNTNRNPGLSKEVIESKLKDYLNVDHVIWLGEGIEGDDTDGHVDDITRFVNETTIVTAIETDETDKNSKPLQKNLDKLKAAVDQDGKGFDVVTLPMPGFVGDAEGRLPASYANFYIANNLVLVPTYKHKNDGIAIATLKELFPERAVVGIDCESLVYGFGALHCVTQQQPKK